MTDPTTAAAPPAVQVSPLSGPPRFLTLGAFRQGDQLFEIAGRSGLDSRVLLPFFRRGGMLFVGLVDRERASRAVRGAPLLGLEALSHDFRAIDETADIRGGAERLLTEVAGLRQQAHGLPIPLPSFARSIGYLSELCLPLLVPVDPPDLDGAEALARGLPLRGGGSGTLRFFPLEVALSLLDDPGGPPLAEELQVLLRALAPPARPSSGPERDPALAQAASWWSARGAHERAALSAAGDRLLARAAGHVLDADALAALPSTHAVKEFTRAPTPQALRFLKLHEVRTEAGRFEVVTPASNVALTLLPMVQTSAGTFFLLWREVRPAALERQERAPLFDLPVPARYLNATGFFLPKEAAAQAAGGDLSGLAALAPGLLGKALGTTVAIKELHFLGRPSEPAPGLSSELRVAAAALLDADSIAALPEEAVLLEAQELAEAVAAGQVRDPVVVYGLLALAPRLAEPLDPFFAARSGEPEPRAAFLEAMTRGSEVQRRLQGYSSIEKEQLQAPTYARLMTLLQHEYGLRIAYPKTEKDRGFFKAAFRVFMAADRGDDDRALQGLHWSHDAYHFALGNFLVPPPPDFEAWYTGGAPAPAEQPPEGPAWDRYSRALKAAENEATFFSFWTLYDEHLPLARHVGKLTFWEALRDLGITLRAEARAIYDDVVDRALLPGRIKDHPVYQAREDIRALFTYLLGFRPYHYKDIAIAWRFGVKDPYRGYLARFGIYESDLDKYLAHVTSFWDRLGQLPRGLNPLFCALADVRLDLQLRVWDVTKALRLLRAATLSSTLPLPDGGRALRASLLASVEPLLGELEQVRAELSLLRARVHDAEATPRNQTLLAQAGALGAQVESVRDRLWTWAAGTGLLAAAVLDDERLRELPR